jgi:16S rRNA (adenine1518-N6/adenine1519-N6)-dimethyltransferase
MTASFADPAGHRPRRSLGQNFLVDRGIQQRIVEAALAGAPESEMDAAPTPPPFAGPVLEIGPGKGALTEWLAEEANRLILVELDRDLARAHRERWAENPGIQVVEESILDHPLSHHVPEVETLSVVGNIPYNLTSPILFHLLASPRPARITLMVQREVADRILAEPGTKAYGALSVGVRTVANVEFLFGVPAGAFRPRPKVDSAVIRITPIRPAPLSPEAEAGVRDLTRALFQWRRKQLGKILRDHPDLGVSGARVPGLLDALGLRAEQRPETLPPEVFVDLWRGLADER